LKKRIEDFKEKPVEISESDLKDGSALWGSVWN
jgi:hypothetical protein